MDNNDDEIPEFDVATQNLVNAARATAAAFEARSGYREAVLALVAAALALALAGLLPGLRFQPKDEELVGFYLKKKVKAEAFPVADMMRESNVMLYNPMTIAATLPKLGDREWYFFTPRDRKYRRGIRPDRGTDGGFWKATGADKAVSVDGETIGFKRSLVFYLDKERVGELDIKTNWIMYEYRLNQPSRIQEYEEDMRLDDWVLCSIHEQPKRVAVNRVKRKRKEKTPVDDAAVDADDNRVVVEQENNANLEQQPNTSTSVEAVAVAEQYRYQHDQYLEQQPLPILDVVEQEQYAYHLPTTLDHHHVPVINQQQQYAAQQPSSSSSVEAEQYRRYQQYQYLEQQPMPLISNNNATTSTSASASASASAEAEQYYRSYQQDQPEQLQPSLRVPVNSLDPGLSFNWQDFLNFNNLDQVVGDDYNNSGLCQQQQQNQAFANNNNSNHALNCQHFQHQHKG